MNRENEEPNLHEMQRSPKQVKVLIK